MLNSADQRFPGFPNVGGQVSGPLHVAGVGAVDHRQEHGERGAGRQQEATGDGTKGTYFG